MDDNITQGLSMELQPGEAVSHIIAVVVVERMEDFEQEVRIITTPQTGRITEMGALTEALEQAKMPDYDYGDDDE